VPATLATPVPPGQTPAPEALATPAPVVVTGGCSGVQCAFNEECRPDDRGPQFPGKCAQKQNVDTTTGGTGTKAAPSGGLELWVILVIAGVALVLLMICCCVVVVCVVKKNNRSERGAIHSTNQSVGMYELHNGGAINYPSGGVGHTFAGSLMDNQGQGYAQGGYGADMNTGGVYPSVSEGAGAYPSGGSGSVAYTSAGGNSRDIPAF
jgi:hypothetical protein